MTSATIVTRSGSRLRARNVFEDDRGVHCEVAVTTTTLVGDAVRPVAVASIRWEERYVPLRHIELIVLDQAEDA